MKRSKIRLLLAVLALQAAGVAFAEVGNAAFRCGGIGNMEQQQFQAAAPQHDALLTFATTSGSYVAGVDVRITTEAGEPVIRSRCDGPLMLVDLPRRGRYHVEAAHEGSTQRKAITIGERTSRLSFTWPVS